MKKILSLLLAIMMLVPTCSAKLNADETDGCPLEVLETPQNIRIENNILRWDPVEGADAYEIRVGYRQGATVDTKETFYDLFSIDLFAEIEYEESMNFSVYALAPQGCYEYNTPEDQPGELNNVALVNAGRYRVIAANSDGGSVETVTGNFVFDAITVTVTPNDNYVYFVGDEKVSEERNVSIPLSEFKDNEYLITFYTPFYVEFGAGHEDAAESAVNIPPLADNPHEVDGSLFTTYISFPDSYPAAFYAIMVTFGIIAYDEVEDYLINGNEEFLGAYIEDSIASYKELNDFYMKIDDDPSLKDVGNKFYVIWMNYSNDGNKKWTRGNKNDVTFTYRRNIDDKGYESLTMTAASTFECFDEVLVDGVALKEDAYEIEEGSLVLTLKKDYLDTLKAGKHKVEAVFNYSGLYGGLADTENQIRSTAILTIEDPTPVTPVYPIPKTGIE